MVLWILSGWLDPKIFLFSAADPDVYPGSRIRILSHPGYRGQKSTGSWIRIRNTDQDPPLDH
jgi:hypothetical protein